MNVRPSTTSSPRHALRWLLLAATVALLAGLALPSAAAAITIHWIDGPLHGWENPANWSPQQVPGPNDYVVIDGPNEVIHCLYSVTFQGIDIAVTAVSFDGDLTLTQGTSNIHDGINVGGVLTLEPAATLRVEGPYNASAPVTATVVNYGTIIGRKQTSLQPSIGSPVYNYGSVTCDSGMLWLIAGGTGGALSTFGGGAGTVQMSGSGWTLQGGCAFTGGVDLNTVATIPLGATVTCQGSDSLTGGLLGPGTLRVAPGATLALGATTGGFGDSVTLDNDGTVVANDTSPYQWHAGTLFANSGVLDIQTGGLGPDKPAAGGGGSLLNTGTITSEGTNPYIALPLDNQGTISVTAGKLSLQGGTSVPATGDFLGSGPGRVRFEFGAANPTIFELADGVGLGNVDVTSASTLVVKPGATVSMVGANTTSGAYPLEGPGTLRLLTGATLTTSGSPILAAGLHFDVEGTFAQTGSTIWEAGTVLHNSGTIDLQADVDISASRSNGAGTIVNSGTITKSAGTGTSTISPTLTNTGTISVLAGRLTLPAGVLANYNVTTKTLTGGSYRVTAPGLLRINNADVATLAADVRLSGAAAKIEDSAALDALRSLANVTSAGALDSRPAGPSRAPARWQAPAPCTSAPPAASPSRAASSRRPPAPPTSPLRMRPSRRAAPAPRST